MERVEIPLGEIPVELINEASFLAQVLPRVAKGRLCISKIS